MFGKKTWTSFKTLIVSRFDSLMKDVGDINAQWDVNIVWKEKDGKIRKYVGFLY